MNKHNQNIPKSSDVWIFMFVMIITMIVLGRIKLPFNYQYFLLTPLIITLLLMIFIKSMHYNIKRTLSLNKMKWGNLPLIILMTCVAFVILYGVEIIILSFMGEVQSKEIQEGIENAFQPITQLPLWAIISLLVILPAITEELVFRGVVLNGFLSRHSKRRAVIWSSIMFALLHSLYPIPIFFLALFLGLLAIKTKSILAPIIAHMTYNLINVLFMLYYAGLKPALSENMFTLFNISIFICSILTFVAILKVFLVYNTKTNI